MRDEKSRINYSNYFNKENVVKKIENAMNEKKHEGPELLLLPTKSNMGAELNGK